jgi:hypothetical protein
MAHALQHTHEDQQLALDDRWSAPQARSHSTRRAERRPLCAWCREKEARYGFRDGDEEPDARPRTLCFQCFRVELDRRHAVAAQLARGWNASQTALPLEHTLEQLTHRRRRAQIAARHALGGHR